MVDKIKWFWRYYRRYRYVLAVLILLTPLQAAFQVSIPRMIEFSIDYFESDQVPAGIAGADGSYSIHRPAVAPRLDEPEIGMVV